MCKNAPAPPRAGTGFSPSPQNFENYSAQRQQTQPYGRQMQSQYDYNARSGQLDSMRNRAAQNQQQKYNLWQNQQLSPPRPQMPQQQGIPGGRIQGLPQSPGQQQRNPYGQAQNAALSSFNSGSSGYQPNPNMLGSAGAQGGFGQQFNFNQQLRPQGLTELQRPQQPQPQVAYGGPPPPQRIR